MTHATDTPQNELRAKLGQALVAATQGDGALIEDLLTEDRLTLLNVLAPYLNAQQDDAVRQEAVSLLQRLVAPQALPLLARALTDPLADIRIRAAQILYQHYTPQELAAYSELGEALLRSVEAGNDNAAAILLLAHFPGQAAQQLLKQLWLQKSAVQTELYAWSPVVPVSWVAEIALSRMGDEQARFALLDKIEAAEPRFLEFLLSVLQEIDSPSVLHALAQASLHNSTEIQSGLPAGIRPRRRIQDLAVEQFVKTLQLPVDFTVDSTRRFTEREIEQVWQALHQRLPQA